MTHALNTTAGRAIAADRPHGAFIVPVWPPHVPPRIKLFGRILRCVQWLKVQGFDVLAVQQGPRVPRVHIKPGPLCDKLEGAIAHYERSAAGERRYKVVVRLGCEVRWSDNGGAA